MFSNYFKIAIRHFIKRKGYFFLNILGLVTGITCCLLIFHYVSYEKSYDTFQPASDRVSRLRLSVFQNGKEQLQSAAVYPAIAPAMKKEFPEVENFARLHTANLLLSNDETNTRFNETNGFFADPSFVKMFDVKMINQPDTNLLKNPYHIILSESMAKKYFGHAEAIGKTLTVKNPSFLQTYLVTGIFKDYPDNSHLTFDFLASYSTYDKILQHYGYPVSFTEDSWEFRDFYAYLQLKEGTDWKNLQEKLPAFCNRHINSKEANINNNTRNELYLTPLKDIFLYSNYFYETGARGNGQAVSFLLLIALFIICIAWTNYINLATARSVERAKEVGIRKVLGGLRLHLIKQFLIESFLLNAAALFISLLLFCALRDGFDVFTGKNEPVYPLLSVKYWVIFGIIFFSGTLLSGIYPAFVLSAFNPITVLKGFFKRSTQGIVLRKGLIIFQFIVSIGLIASTIIVYQQMAYMASRPLGADIDQTLIVQGAVSQSDTAYRDAYQSFKNELLQQSGIKNVAASTSVMGKEIVWTRNMQRLDIPNAAAVPVYHVGIDYDFIPNYNIKVVAGRNFSKQYGTDSKAVLLNEKAVQVLGFKNPGDAINKIIKRSGDTVTIAGIVSDFHQQGLQKEITPMIFLLMPDVRSFYSVKVQSGDLHQAITSIKNRWEKYFPDDPFTYSFLNEDYGRQYKSNNLFKKVFGVFALLAILIASFGLLGLSAYKVLQQAKEISIRKVLGAGVSNISILLTKGFLQLIVIAFLTSIPLTWFVMSKWLQNFAYRVDIQWWVFVVASLVAIFIALVTIGFHIIKAATANPARSLKTS